MQEKITLIGRGWLGAPLEDRLKELGHEVFSTSSTSNGSSVKFDILNDPFPSNLPTNDILIYTIPPLGQNEVENFFKNIPIDQKIVFISSTSVYGKNLGFVDESFEINLKNTNSPILIQSETLLRNKFKNLTIIRPGGLYGLQRHPAFFLQGKTNLTTGSEILHLVHLDDCIDSILSIIKLNIWGEIINLISDLRIEKKIYYPTICKNLKIPPPIYDNYILEKPTNIQNEKAKKLLHINFKNPLDYQIN